MSTNNYSVALRARTMQAFSQRLYNVYILLHHENNELLADKVYRLQQDCVFGDISDLSVAKNKLKKIAGL